MKIYKIGKGHRGIRVLQCDERQFPCQVWQQLPLDFGLKKVGFLSTKSVGAPHNARKTIIEATGQ